jgi:signal transduction histidine kinase/CheY-like chemotaxis protein
MTGTNLQKHDERVLLLTPTGRDAFLTEKYLLEMDVPTVACASMEELCVHLDTGAGTALVSEEALSNEALTCLIEALQNQPPWSDLPVIVLTSPGSTPSRINTLRLLSQAVNLSLVERPTRVITLVSAIRSALRARHRQYEVRAHLCEQKRAQEERSRLLEEAIDARQQAEAANLAKDIFLATLSHELRTPLTAVLGWTAILRRGLRDEGILRHGLEVIERNAHSQNQLIQDLLDVSRIVTGKLRLDVKPLCLGPVIEAAVDSVRQAADARSIRLDVTCSKNLPLVNGDCDRLQQIVWNLLSNAIKFTPAGGHVDVRAESSGSKVEITVRDDGQGIPPEFVPHVFERFQQADGSTTRTHGGLGLGLAVVRHLVEQHGGAVTASSDGTGRGATFLVTLPAAAGTAVAYNTEASLTLDEPEIQDVETESILNGTRVLVVDDQQDARELLELILEHAGAEVATAASAVEALSKLQQSKIDVLVSDVGMPEHDGFELMRNVRALGPAQGGSVPAIALTAYASAEDRRKSLEAGFEQHVTKPVEPARFVAVVAQLARR